MIARIQKSMAEKDKGFTLIELLVVVIIIGILAAIAIPVFLNQRQKAVDSSIQSDLRTVTLAVESYWNDQQAYPATGAVTVDTTQKLTIGETVVGTLSKGNLLTYANDGQSYSVTITNPNGTNDKGFTYNSSVGKQTKN